MRKVKSDSHRPIQKNPSAPHGSQYTPAVPSGAGGLQMVAADIHTVGPSERSKLHARPENALFPYAYMTDLFPPTSFTVSSTMNLPPSIDRPCHLV